MNIKKVAYELIHNKWSWLKVIFALLLVEYVITHKWEKISRSWIVNIDCKLNCFTINQICACILEQILKIWIFKNILWFNLCKELKSELKNLK